jgi:glycosyltransferase involved in cell wall biosynthesis
VIRPQARISSVPNDQEGPLAVVRTKITVAIPAYNAEPWLRETLDSVLAQSFPAHEIIVVDDGSKDGTEEVARSFGDRIRYIKQPNQGVSAARRMAILEATGDWIAFLDSDDLMAPEKLEKQVAVIEATPSLVVVYSAFTYLYGDGTTSVAPVFPAQNLWPALRYRTPILPSTSIVRRSALEEIEAFKGWTNTGEDWQLWFCLVRRYGKDAFRDVPESLTFYRSWENSASKNFKRFARGTLDLVDNLLVEDLTGWRKSLWKHRIEARIYFHTSLGFREIKDERYWEYALESFFKWPFWGPTMPPQRYRVFAHMLYTRLRNFRLNFRYWWPVRSCREGL